MAQMAYGPDPRYLKDLSRKKEVDAAFAEQAETHKGHLWDVDSHIRGRWGGVGAISGLVLAAWDPFDWHGRLHFDQSPGMLLVLAAACIVGGFAIGFVAASIRRRLTGED